MNGTTGISFASAGLFVFLIVSQIFAVSLLPRTAGFTNPFWTAACLGVYLVSLWSLAFIIHRGMPISLLIPIMSALIPLATIAVGVLVYGEAASLSRVALLCVACGVIGVASSMK